jgi:copper resistance protein C
MRRSHRVLGTALASFMSLGLVLFVAVGMVSAHAKVIDSNPKMGSTIAKAPTTIIVTTVENMKPGAQFSNLFVYGPNGDLVSQGDAKIPLNNPKEMSITIAPEKNPGIYVVRWITVSADDGDPDQGAFVFTVNPAGVAATPAPTAAKQAATPASTAGTSGTSPWISIVVGVIALLVGLGGGLALGRRRPATASTTSTDQAVPEKKKTTPTP